MGFGKALLSGFIGACTVSLINESVRQFVKDAPRLDVLGKRAVGIPMMESGMQPPRGKDLYWYTLGGDLLLNGLYFSLVGIKGAEKAFQTGTGLGMAAGVGAVVLPGKMGLGDEMTARTSQTEIMTVAWYLAGGLAAAAAYQAFSSDSENESSARREYGLTRASD